MNAAQELRKLYKQYDVELFKNKHRLIAFIKDLVEPKDAAMLTLAVSQNVAIYIIDNVSSEKDIKSILIIVNELISVYMWQEELAKTTVNYFVYAKFGTMAEIIDTTEHSMNMKLKNQVSIGTTTESSDNIIGVAENNNPNIIEMQDFLIVNKVLVKYLGSQADIILPSNISSIGDRAFYKCMDIQSISMPYKVKSIGSEAFLSCRNLTKVSLSHKLKSIGTRSFFNCTKLTEIIFPKGIKEILDEAFGDCRSLAYIDLPDSLNFIGNSAFECCSDLEKIIINSKLKSIGDRAFKSCSKLNALELSVRTIGNETFKDCLDLTTVHFLDGLSAIGYSILSGCEKIETIIVPPTLKYIKTRNQFTPQKFVQERINKNHMQIIVPGDTLWLYFV
ncbi:MAG: hypothetical protein ATN31_06340 [Candidatus Epulonipiscioides saccharophilum]|nr:MAG: hypothetical protein ATN31_06340 [Epulopiscium sp. AS2M-Bin001]